MSTTADRRVGFDSVRLPVFGESLKGKGLTAGLALAFSAILVAGTSIPTPAAAFGISFGGIRFHVPGGGGYRHHGGGGGGGHHHRHGHDDEDDNDSSDELTKGKSNERDNVTKQDLNPKTPSNVVLDPANGAPSPASSTPSNAGSAPKLVPAMATDGPTTAEASALYEHGPDFTPER
jgi:hypothetical protein